ncbi:hypothetical protein SAMN05421759_12037 [Roseivivax lentus]|uniref:Uncharacterized protein n=1 Tax=Roseivivax lentus TaxID=633194 RepID=A0A1N7PUF2_9RHOB|nr:hypothetical protein [Roseivivax lentus]SIT14238.1 hypothetical protein SAMN05421759_12037 [Roseivivax lentus]
MAMNVHAPKRTSWLVWAGVAAGAIVLIAAFGYAFDWFGTDATSTVAPAIEQAVPATE